MYYANATGIVMDDFGKLLKANPNLNTIKMKYNSGTGDNKVGFYMTLHCDQDIKNLLVSFTKEMTEVFVSGKVTKSKNIKDGETFVNELMFVDALQVLKNGKYDKKPDEETKDIQDTDDEDTSKVKPKYNF